MPELIRVDLHTHTWFSPDSLTSPQRLIRAARKAGLHRIAVTDHDMIDGALEAHALAPDLVIVGEEIRCGCQTEVIGLFLQRLIPGGMSVEETIAAIKEQGGVVFAPHPFAYRSGGAQKATKLLPLTDIAEVYNSRAFYPPWNQSAVDHCARLDVPGVASSDTHFPWELGRAYIEMPSFTDAASFQQAIRHASLVRNGRATPMIHVASVTIHLVRRLLGRHLGSPFGYSPKPQSVLAE